MRWLADLLDDVRYTCRTLRHSRTFALGTILTLGLGIGVNTAVFSVVNALLFRPLPVRGGERLVVLGSRAPGTAALGPMSFADLEDYRTATRAVLDDIAGYSVGFIGLAPEPGSTFALRASADKRPARVLATWVTGNYFELLGIQPALGRLIHSAEGAPGRIDPVVVLGHATWRQRFNGDSSIVGKTVRLNGRVCTIVGVVPPGFVGTFAFSESEVYLPITWAAGLHDDRGSRFLHTLARLRTGATLQQAQAVADLVAGRLAQEHPLTNAQVGVSVLPERLARPEESNAQSNQFVAAALLGLVALVFVVAAVNVTSLLLVRFLSRRKELAVRLALGAGRARLAQHLLAESAVLCCLGGVAGVAFGAAAARALTLVRLPGDLPVRFDFSFDRRVVAYALAVTAVTAIIVGSTAAGRLSKTTIDEALRDRGSGATPSRAGERLRKTLVVAQVAVTVVLTLAGGLFVRGLSAAQRVDLGFLPERVLNVQMDVGQVGYSESKGRAFFDDVEARIRELPGVDAMAYAFSVPFGYVNLGSSVHTPDQLAARSEHIRAGTNIVAPHYFSTLSIPIESGRAFTPADARDAPRVAIVNRRLADLLWPDQDAIGRRFKEVTEGSPWMEVVGVTRTGKYQLLFEDPLPYYYVPIAQHYTALRVLHLRSRVSPEGISQAVERVIHGLEPDLPLYDVQSMTKALDSARGRFLVRAAAFFAAVLALLALVLTVLGLYGVVAYVTSQRTRELGVRIALGATARNVVQLVVTEAARLTLLGAAIGFAGAYVSAPLLRRLLFGVAPTDWVAFAVALVGLIAVTAAATWMPARRAARMDPLRALRSE
jgi:predicted permease